MRSFLTTILFTFSIALLAQPSEFNLTNCANTSFDGLYTDSGVLKSGAPCYVLSGTNVSLEYDGSRWVFVDYISNPCSGTPISTSEYSNDMVLDVSAATPTGALCGSGSSLMVVANVPSLQSWGVFCLGLMMATALLLGLKQRESLFIS